MTGLTNRLIPFSTLSLFVCKVVSDYAHFNVDDPSLSVCLSVFLSVSVFLASDSSETVEIIIIKLGTVTASDMVMHHVFIILTVTFIQGHTDLNPENNKRSIISETVQAIPLKCAVKIV